MFLDRRSLLVPDQTLGTVRAYEVDDRGDPIPSTYRPFISAMPEAESATVDPVTGDWVTRRKPVMADAPFPAVQWSAEAPAEHKGKPRSKASELPTSVLKLISQMTISGPKKRRSRHCAVCLAEDQAVVSRCGTCGVWLCCREFVATHTKRTKQS